MSISLKGLENKTENLTKEKRFFGGAGAKTKLL
jgi:hypothetical protein